MNDTPPAAASEASSTFRNSYRQLNPDEIKAVQFIKECAGTMEHAIRSAAVLTSDARRLAVAQTKLEEAVMWAVKGITG